ncbi:SDR family oxidoreductase [Kineococcus sp. SYSU DK001]|uniref:SDR family oxidoreductase n=1 Tax=Kineococcus sp. SYSU DK001 TaxID=3383122 RepID=UPI003D7ED185
MTDHVEGKVIAVTGASSGIGAASAELLAARGARVVLGARREGPLADLAGRIDPSGRRSAWRATDVTRPDDVHALVDLAGERFGRLDVLIANAGVMPISPLDDLRTRDWDRMVDVNLKGVLHGIAAALPVFRRQGTGHFVTVASTAAHKTVPDQAVYSGTKFAVRALCEGLRQEAGATVRVTTVSPGIVATNFADGIPGRELRDRLARVRDDIALSPRAVAETIAFAIGCPPEVDVNEVVLRPTAQG